MLLQQVRPFRTHIFYYSKYMYLYFLFLAELAVRYKTDGMLAYVELVQRKEKEIGCDVLTHQKW
jgi:isocitrate lyase